MDLYHIYILRCQDNSLYTGIAKDYKIRYKDHVLGIGAKYTRSHKPIKIEIVFTTQDRSKASKIENYIKSKTKKEKEDIIKNYKNFIDEVKGTKDIEIFYLKR